MTTVGGPEGRFVVRDGEDAYLISHYDRMAPFLMSVVSDSDLWMYLSSSGGLTAGRVNEDNCLFPYETDDRLHVGYGVTGPFTILRAKRDDGEVVIWRPFDPRRRGAGVERNLYKSIVGSWVEFEEIDHRLGLTFGYRWSNSQRFGFVRSATLQRDPASVVRSAAVLDGVLNVLPAGVPLGLQQTSSTLVDAYKRSEVDPATGLGLFTLESQITDRAEAAESLRANVVWARGIDSGTVLLDTGQLGRFVAAGTVEGEAVTLGRRGSYLMAFEPDFQRESAQWDLVADVGLGHGPVQQLRALARDGSDRGALIRDDIATCRANLVGSIACADGLQRTADRMATAHHGLNVLFNNMRGGVFDHNHAIPKDDFLDFCGERNVSLLETHGDFFANLAPATEVGQLLQAAAGGGTDLLRLAYEYLPLFFSRRHGDPSRPWNRFSIRVRNPDGSRRLDYQGNWRDIFQNWEALARSFPEFLESIIAKFVNASTIDGHNPFRLTRHGSDWEVPAPDDPWSNIGYWGDHQIVYLLRLLEASASYHPGAITRLLDQAVFSYAEVPYRIAPYDQIVADPKNTITFDTARAQALAARVAEVGADGRLLHADDGSVLCVTLAEKLLVPALAKLCNLVLDGGIWMNTQRPEWNDANNALAGHGASMVTLSYLRRYLAWLARLFEPEHRAFEVSTEVVEWFRQVSAALREQQPSLNGPVTDSARRRLLDALGTAFSDYRAQVYRNGLSGRARLEATAVVELCTTALAYLDHSIDANRRADGLSHSYNLVTLHPDGASVEHLHEMLEGQVAVLSSGVLSVEQALDLIDALFASAIYRPDQRSFMLYPARSLPSFLERNVIPADRVTANPLLAALAEAAETSVIEEDAFGAHRFHPDCVTAANLEAALDRLADVPRWSALVAAHRPATLETFEAVFGHHAFTGRSGSMYKYEGLGSIYWHMVAKLLVAIQEIFFEAVDGDAAAATVAALADAYHRVRHGLGFNKTPGVYGAFPMDPYSHTPAHGGAQQPGMTGQVKEEIITRMVELGVRVSQGTVRFQPLLLSRSEFLTAATSWQVFDLAGGTEELALAAGSLGFTFCGIPVVYRLTDADPAVSLIDAAGQVTTVPGSRLDTAASRLLFQRRGAIVRITVDIAESMLLAGSARQPGT